MKKLHLLFTLIVLAAFVSCGKDDGGSGTSEGTAIKGTSGTTGTSATGIFSSGSAFMYTSGFTHFFLLCEGEAKNWNDALKKPYLKIAISDASILKDVTAMADISKAIDINDPRFANVECPVSVTWNVGNGMRFMGKYGYNGGTNCYKFDTGSLLVAEGPMNGMYVIAFVGRGVDKDNEEWGADWSYGGQFARK